MEGKFKHFALLTAVLFSLVLSCRGIKFRAEATPTNIEHIDTPAPDTAEKSDDKIQDTVKPDSSTKSESGTDGKQQEPPPTAEAPVPDTTSNKEASNNNPVNTENVKKEGTESTSGNKEKMDDFPSDKKAEIKKNDNGQSSDSGKDAVVISRPCFPSEKPEISAAQQQTGEQKVEESGGSSHEKPAPAESIPHTENNIDSTKEEDATKDSKPATPNAQEESEQQTKSATKEKEKVPEKDEPKKSDQVLTTPEETSAPPANETKSPPTPAARDMKVEPGMEDLKISSEVPHVDEDHREEDMPSFEEWKQKMLHEQEKEKKSKQITQPVQASPSTPNQVAKNRVNYAAMTCGAKVLSVNPEAQFPSYILSENKDQYMINPCKAKKWFVIELCEPVQVKRLEIANLELFSSTPASFLMQISDRYPTKEWRTVGTFHARDERSIQVFLLSDEQMYAKYIRIEILSHFGDEHYCPLSIVRVFGTSEEEEYEQSEQGGQLDAAAEDSSAGVAEADKDKPTNLFTSATDTVLSLVKTVLHSEDADSNGTEEAASEGTVTLEQTKAGDIPNATTKDQITSCSTDQSTTEKQGDKEGSSGDSKPQPAKPDVSTGSAKDTTKAPAESDRPLVVKIEGDKDEGSSNQQAGHSDMVTLIDSPSKLEGGESLHSILSKCNFCNKRGKTAPCNFDRTSTCGYYKTLTFVYPTSCEAKPSKPETEKTTADSSKPVTKSSQKEGSAPEISKPVVSKQETVSDKQETPEKADLSSSSTDSGEKKDSIGSSEEGAQTVSQSAATKIKVDVTTTSESAVVDQIKPTPSLKIPDASTDHKNTEVTEPKSAESGSKDKPTEKAASQEKAPVPPLESSQPVPSPVTAEETPPKPGCKKSPDGSSEACGEVPEVIQVPPTKAADAGTGTTQPSPGTTTDQAPQETQKTVPPVPTATVKQTVETTKDATGSAESVPVKDKPANGGASNGGEMKKIYADNATTTDTDKQMNVALEMEEAPVKTSGGKQSAFMRLNNRIKTLEQNLSLSSRYLEELSQRYRKKMEEMYASLDFAIDQLAETAKSAEERDKKQQENISILQTQIHNLTGVVARLSDEMGSLQHQMIERHLFLMIAEVLIFMVVMATCITRNSERLPPTKDELMEIRELIRKMPETPNINRHRRQKSDESVRPRSSSSITLTEKWPLDDINIRPSGSDSNLTIIPPTIPIFIDSNSSIADFPRKKKKKKLSTKLHVHATKSEPTAARHNCPPSVTTLEANSQLSSAGLLFGASEIKALNSADSDESGRTVKSSQNSAHQTEARRSLFSDSHTGAKQKSSSHHQNRVVNNTAGLVNSHALTNGHDHTSSHKYKDNNDHRKDTHKHRTESHTKREKSDASVQTHSRGRVDKCSQAYHGQTQSNDHSKMNGHDTTNTAWKQWFPSQKK